MIYFDNAATGGFKPRSVSDTANTVIRYLSANPGRSGHRLSVSGAEMVFNCRKILSEFFGGTPERVVFTKNCTEALNVAIFGTLKKGGHVITTTFEHNSVLRPLYFLKNQGLIKLDVISPSLSVPLELAIKNAIRENTYMVVTTAVSNVTGKAFPIDRIGKICKNHNLLYLVDGAQGGGHLPINIDRQNISMLCLAGHKGLMGIMGSGVLIFNEQTEISPLIMGGTGSESFNLNQPECYPERLESGTLNLPAIASLYEGVRIIKDNLENYSKHLIESTQKIIDGLNTIPKARCYSLANRSGIVAFDLLNMPSEDVASALNYEYDIAVRGGLHCAPLTHKFLGTHENGLVRASLSVQNSTREIYYFLNAVRKLAEG
ncbi:MAG: aminotransferase class V-fold PLP-dependent enzyme [Clostridia bacterium]|nr:aminotransferase class V-fold PLP-dependent enzyme [Clostridia bacterium]